VQSSSDNIVINDHGNECDEVLLDNNFVKPDLFKTQKRSNRVCDISAPNFPSKLAGKKVHRHGSTAIASGDKVPPSGSPRVHRRLNTPSSNEECDSLASDENSCVTEPRYSSVSRGWEAFSASKQGNEGVPYRTYPSNFDDPRRSTVYIPMRNQFTQQQPTFLPQTAHDRNAAIMASPLGSRGVASVPQVDREKMNAAMGSCQSYDTDGDGMEEFYPLDRKRKHAIVCTDAVEENVTARQGSGSDGAEQSDPS